MAFKSTISFGLVNIPVSLNPAILNNDATFNYLHKKCGERISYIKYCNHCKTEVHQKDLIKGYQYEKDEYVLFDDEDFDKLKSEEDKALEIIGFLDFKEIDPIYFEKSYLISTPKKNKAFALFSKALAKTKKVALIKTVLGTKFYYAILRLGMNGMIMTTLYFHEEVKEEESAFVGSTFTQKEFDLAVKLIENMKITFTPEKYKDEYQAKVQDAITKKIEGKTIKTPRKKKKQSIHDLMDALEKSLKDAKVKRA